MPGKIPALTGACTMFLLFSIAPVQARDCNAGEYANLVAPARDEADSVDLTCSATIASTERITKRVHIGPAASGATLNCAGAQIGYQSDVKEAANRVRLSVRSGSAGDSLLGAPVKDVSVLNCHIVGSVGVGANISFESLKKLSRTRDFIASMQKISPSHITFKKVSITAPRVNGTPVSINLLYISSGSSYINFLDGKIEGEILGGVPIYLDDSSSYNSISDSYFSVKTRDREVIAIDGSFHNTISGNTFINSVNGAIFLYRNCGENGIVRHGFPQHNLIQSNIFNYTLKLKDNQPAVWVASRQNGKRFKSWCDLDNGIEFGSGLDDLDHAKYNRLLGNSFFGISAGNALKIDDGSNELRNNVFK